MTVKEIRPDRQEGKLKQNEGTGYGAFCNTCRQPVDEKYPDFGKMHLVLTGFANPSLSLARSKAYRHDSNTGGSHDITIETSLLPEI
jgi:hypothetical protein